MSRVLVIGDLHLPVAHPAYYQFCCDIAEQWQTDRVVFIGDIIDWHAISFHAKHPDLPGPSDEYKLARRHIARWYDTFPDADVTIGNHDERPGRKVEEADVPRKFLRSYNDIWQTPMWRWVEETIIDDVYYYHGVGSCGKTPAMNTAGRMLMSTVMGHVHSVGGVHWMVGPRSRVFGMDVGCGIDDRAMQFAYGKHNKKKSVLSCGVVIDGVPYHEIMPCGAGERYHRSSFRG
jgi:hypothetical protein